MPRNELLGVVMRVVIGFNCAISLAFFIPFVHAKDI
jgi:hypothetical protein